MKITRTRLYEELDYMNRFLWDSRLTEEQNKENELVITYHKGYGYSLLNYDGSREILKDSTAKEVFLFLEGMDFLLRMTRA
jgi:hypothetical protein